MNAILDRLKEPSTWAGVASGLASFGVLGLTEDGWTQVLMVVPAVAAAVAVFLRERGGR